MLRGLMKERKVSQRWAKRKPPFLKSGKLGSVGAFSTYTRPGGPFLDPGVFLNPKNDLVIYGV